MFFCLCLLCWFVDRPAVAEPPSLSFFIRLLLLLIKTFFRLIPLTFWARSCRHPRSFVHSAVGLLLSICFYFSRMSAINCNPAPSNAVISPSDTWDFALARFTVIFPFCMACALSFIPGQLLRCDCMVFRPRQLLRSLFSQRVAHYHTMEGLGCFFVFA